MAKKDKNDIYGTETRGWNWQRTMGIVIKFMLPIRMFIMDPDQVGINSDSFCVFEYLPHDHLKKIPS